MSFWDTCASKVWRSASGPLCTAKCFAQAAVFRYFPSPWSPRTYSLPSSEVRYGILAVGLVTPAPARVAENIHVGRPESQTLVDVAVAVPARRVVLRARLRGGYIRALRGAFPGRTSPQGLSPAGTSSPYPRGQLREAPRSTSCRREVQRKGSPVRRI